MKKTIKILGTLFLAVIFVVSCSKENDPTDDNLFVGTYNGSVSYTDADSNTIYRPMTVELPWSR